MPYIHCYVALIIMSDFENRKLQEQIDHLKIEIEYEKEWNSIPESLKPTSKGRWEQMCNERKTQASRRLGFPNTRGV